MTSNYQNAIKNLQFLWKNITVYLNIYDKNVNEKCQIHISYHAKFKRSYCHFAFETQNYKYINIKWDDTKKSKFLVFNSYKGGRGGEINPLKSRRKKLGGSTEFSGQHYTAVK